MRGINSPCRGFVQYGINPDICESGFIMSEKEWRVVHQEIDGVEPKGVQPSVPELLEVIRKLGQRLRDKDG